MVESSPQSNQKEEAKEDLAIKIKTVYGMTLYDISALLKEIPLIFFPSLNSTEVCIGQKFKAKYFVHQLILAVVIKPTIQVCS